jgi:heme oxygenase (mycobilin-producing)
MIYYIRIDWREIWKQIVSDGMMKLRMGMMIRVVVERKIKSGEVGRLFHELHMIAVLQKGHISNEMWINVNNNNIITVLSTWQTLEDWNAWKSSRERAEIVEKIEPLLAEKTQITVYEMMSAADLNYFMDPESWMQEHEHPHFEG